jgi:hypothetical protein
MLGICTTSYQAWLDKEMFELKRNEIVEVDGWDRRVLTQEMFDLGKPLMNEVWWSAEI